MYAHAAAAAAVLCALAAAVAAMPAPPQGLDAFYTRTPSGYVLSHCVHQVLSLEETLSLPTSPPPVSRFSSSSLLPAALDR